MFVIILELKISFYKLSLSNSKYNVKIIYHPMVQLRKFLPCQSMAWFPFSYYPIAIRRCSPMADKELIEIPLWQKYTLSVEEASKYFRIGQAKLRRLINENEDADFVLWNGNRPQIKRNQFEEYVDKLNVI